MDFSDLPDNSHISKVPLNSENFNSDSRIPILLTTRDLTASIVFNERFKFLQKRLMKSQKELLQQSS